MIGVPQLYRLLRIGRPSLLSDYFDDGGTGRFRGGCHYLLHLLGHLDLNLFLDHYGLLDHLLHDLWSRRGAAGSSE